MHYSSTFIQMSSTCFTQRSIEQIFYPAIIANKYCKSSHMARNEHLHVTVVCVNRVTM